MIKNSTFMQNSLRMITILVSLSLLTSCAYAPWKENNFNHTTPEERVAYAKKYYDEHPNNTKARQQVYLAKESAINELIALAEEARVQDDLNRANVTYDRILKIEPENRSALLGKKAIDDAIEVNRTLTQAETHINQYQLQMAKRLVHDVLLENPIEKRANDLDESINNKLNLHDPHALELKSKWNKPVSLELREANIKVVFDALSRATGINFILDKDIQPNKKATIYVKDLPFEDAIDMVLSSNDLQKKVLSENTALIYPNTQIKLKNYQDLIIRNFYLSNTSAKQAAELLKMMLKARDIYIDERLNMIVIRDTPEVIRIAEKLIKANDIADSEVMLEIEVLEVSRNRLQQLGITYPNQLSALTTGTGALTLDALKSLDSTTIGVSPNPAVNFKKTTGDVNLLSNPRIRVKNNEKANILVGDKVPIITTTTTANVGVSESVNYLDVGLKLDVQPQITLDNHVNIKVGLEVSSLGEKTITATGSTVYRIGTRNANTMLRLKNGETQILAGLISDEERKTANKLPGIGDIPLLGRLFADQEDTKSKTEIILAITPKVISNIDLPKAEFSEFWSGTSTFITDKPIKSIPQTGLVEENRRQINEDKLQQQRQERMKMQLKMQQTIPKASKENQTDDTLINQINEEPTVTTDNLEQKYYEKNEAQPLDQTQNIVP